MEYLEQTELSKNIRHGFQTGRSVVTEAVNFLESIIIDLVNNSECTMGIFIDLSRAFNSVKHTI